MSVGGTQCIQSNNGDERLTRKEIARLDSLVVTVENVEVDFGERVRVSSGVKCRILLTSNIVSKKSVRCFSVVTCSTQHVDLHS